jgi:predicted membrane channel-forming protein YqfA (hemolysin III family)
MTAAVWTGAVTGAAIKLSCPRGIKPGSIVAYLALGWMILLGMRPMLGSVDALTALLIGVGGVLYSIGVGFHLWRTLPFHNAATLRRNPGNARRLSCARCGLSTSAATRQAQPMTSEPDDERTR